MPNRFFRAVLVVAAILLSMGIGTAFAQDEIFVANGNNSITVHARTANGNVAPLRTLVGAATGLSGPNGIAVDLVNNELIVVNASNNSVTVYARTASGNTAPLRTITGAATGLNTPVGLALDLVNNELAVVNLLGNSVTVYARTANGNVAPVRTLAGAATGMNFPTSAAIDTANNELAVVNASGSSVTVYARTASGNAAPLRTITGAATSLSFPEGLALDTVNNELIVVNGSNSASGNSVTVYARTANGNVAPLRKISGAATGICGPFGAAVDTVNNEIAVANTNSCGNSVVVFNRTANGNVAPLRTLAGASSGISTPSFVAITTGAAPPVAPSFTNGPPASGAVGSPFNFTYTASGTAPITFTVTSGALPPSLVLSSAGVISGTPTTAGTFSGVVTASNGTLPNATQAFSIVIAAAPPTAPSAPIPTMSFWGLVLMSILLAGAIAVRRKR